MHLPHMTADDLDTVCLRLTSIAGALRVLAPRFPGVFVDLPPDSPAVIRLPVVLGTGDPGPVEIADMPDLISEFCGRWNDLAAAAEALPTEVAEGMISGAAVAGDDLAAGAGEVDAAAPAPVPDAAGLGAGISGADLRRRKLSDEDRAQMVALHRAGLSNSEIALHLAMRVQTVGLFLAGPTAKAMIAAAETVANGGAVRPIGEIAARIVADVAGQAVLPAEDGAADAGAVAPGLQVDVSVAHPPVVAEPAAPVEADVPAAAPDLAAESDGFAMPEGLTAEARRIWAYLDGLGYKGRWDAEIDHELVEMLVGGSRAAQVALDLDIDAAAVKSRWVLLSNCILDAKARPTIDGQKTLLAVLRARVVAARHGGAGRV